MGYTFCLRINLRRCTAISIHNAKPIGPFHIRTSSVGRDPVPSSANREPYDVGKSASGFTLVELLCVVGIIASLAGLLFPVLASARREAKSTTAISNVRTIGMSVSLYSADYDGLNPYGVDDCSRTFPWLFQEFETLVPSLPLYTTLLGPYGSTAEVFRHPLDQGLHRSENGGMPYVRLPRLYDAVGSSYLYNVNLRDPDISHEGDLANAVVFQSAAGFWECGCNEIPEGYDSPDQLPNKGVDFRYVTGMADGRAKVSTFAFIHREF
jgi:prepilin-type N-terminal cleavage/methylation domain-containing protein